MSDPKVHHYFVVILIAAAFLLLMRTQAKRQYPELSDNSAKEYIFQGERHFRNLRQLTFEGKNIDANFSPDGKKLVFQYFDDETPCSQIYIMDIKSGETKLASPKSGMATSGNFQYPNNDKIVFSSNHHGNKSCFPSHDPREDSSWQLPEGHDIFRTEASGIKMVNLTNQKGYDSEATVAQNGSRIVYTSIISKDLEVWTMNVDGSDRRMLTNQLGYDGEPLFSHDGRKIVWRAYYPKTEDEIAAYNILISKKMIRPMNFQILAMNSDGTNKQQITQNNGANYAPFFFPNNERIVFFSNMADPKGKDFDLWAINLDGTNLEQITFYDGFDGFPTFSPNGKYFVFTSDRNQARVGDTNLFIAEWIN